MQRIFPFSLNIRQRVIVGLTIVLIVMGSLGTMSYHHLRQIERKQRFVQIADDLANNILEIRRYEKNYLLYGSSEDLAENEKYIQELVEVVRNIPPDIKELRAAPLLMTIEKELGAYRVVMNRIAELETPGQVPVDAHLVEQLREHGKGLVDQSRQLVTFERERILHIINTLKTQLFSSLGIFLVLGSFLIPVVAHNIIQPLRIIERTTHRIAEGDFRPLPVLDTRDETQRVVEAFNRMISELCVHQEQLLQAKKLSSLGTLTSGIAHQLNNPLNNISTSCQIVLEELNDMDKGLMEKMLTNIEQEVHRARDIVRGLLEFSRIREFCLAPTPLREVVEKSISLISSQIPPGIDVLRDIPPDLTLTMDPQRMQQVFLNLLENAVHAMPSPPGEIRIAAQRDSGGGNTVITFADSGNGIAPEDLGHVFDPFFTTKEVGAGTGLGLSVVYGIVKKHGGAISVESREGEGTKFTITLPVADVC